MVPEGNRDHHYHGLENGSRQAGRQAGGHGTGVVVKI